MKLFQIAEKSYLKENLSGSVDFVPEKYKIFDFRKKTSIVFVYQYAAYNMHNSQNVPILRPFTDPLTVHKWNSAIFCPTKWISNFIQNSKILRLSQNQVRNPQIVWLSWISQLKIVNRTRDLYSSLLCMNSLNDMHIMERDQFLWCSW